MLGTEQIDGRIIEMGEAVRAEVLYELNMNVSFNEFFRLKMIKDSIQEQFLNYNLYKYQV